MIRHDGNYDITLREKMYGGEGTVKIEHFWKADELKATTRLCARLSLEPGTSIGLHQHDNEEEVFVIISGQGRVNDDGRQDLVGPGDTILTGGGAGHAVEAVGDEPLVMVAFIVQY